MRNMGGLLVVAAGVFFAVLGVKGTQHTALPSLFPPISGSSNTPGLQIQPAQPGDPSSGSSVTGNSGSFD